LLHSLADPKPRIEFVEGVIMEGLQTGPDSSLAADQQFHLVANSLAQLLETATREFARDRVAAKASLVTASHILQAEILTAKQEKNI